MLRLIFFAIFSINALLSGQALAQNRVSPEFWYKLHQADRIFLFPVSWEIMQSGLNSLDVALEAENFTEYWALAWHGDDSLSLINERARIRVIRVHSFGEEGESPFHYLVLNEAEFTRFLGLDSSLAGRDDKVIWMQLPDPEALEQSFVLKASSKYFVTVHLSIDFDGSGHLF